LDETMTPLVCSWLLSLTGAVMFFAAGAAFVARRFGRIASVEREVLERELTQRTAERQSLFRELEIERSARVTPVPEPVAEDAVSDAGLLREVALIRERLTTRESQLEALRDENTKLRAVEEDLAQTKREVATLTEQTRVLRAQVFVNIAAKSPAVLGLNAAAARGDNPNLPRPRTPTPTISATGRALQTIVDTETRLGRAQSAVIADELGLLVAASGATNEYNDALAALGAYLADFGSKTRGILPLRNLRQVVVRDVHDVTLTVRPLATDDPGLALVTLAVEPPSTANDNRQN
jgi:predicted regulator of Ras-like GTPase activity (Roadblock/LC7/MglB family)